MHTTKGQSMGSLEGITRSSEQRAAGLWGQERADALMPVIADVASNVFRVSQAPPPPDEEPGSYF